MTAGPAIRALPAIVCAACALAVVPAVSRADQYAVDYCRNWDSGAPAATFGGLETAGGAITNNCGLPDPAAGLSSTVGNPMTPETTTTLALQVPAALPNLRIERLQTAYSSPSSTGIPGFLRLFAGGGVLVARLTNDAAQAPVEDWNPLPPATRRVAWDIYCSNNPGTCQFAGATVLTVTRTRLFLNENVAPKLTITGGALVGSVPKSGLEGVTFDAGDADSGVASVSVALGGTVVGGIDYPCPHTDWSACPRDELNQLLQIDTTKVPDGNYELIVTVRDAAANVLPRSLGVITVANGPGSAANGANPSRLARLSARFTTTKKRSRTLHFTSSPTVKGVLLDERGQPITGATIALLGRPRQSGGDDAQLATAATGADGGFSAKLPAGPSRTITFAYTAFSSDARPATTATLRTNVRAIVSARVSPRSSRPGGRITLTGKLKLLPRKGVVVTIQARQGSAWHTIDDVRTTATGSFRWRYRFAGNQARRTYAFRARVSSPNYPFAAANSRPARVRVR